MTPLPLDVLLAECERRGLLRPRWAQHLHPKQLAILDDKSPAKCALAGRRGGKTEVGIAGLLDACERYPGSTVLYLALTAKNARRILWRKLLDFNRRFNLGLKLDKQALEAEHPNGARILLAGADREDLIERLRGDAYSRVIVDEAASFGSDTLEYLCDEVIGPALADFEGDIWLIGSPGAACVGYFYKATEGAAAWPTYRWDMRDNPYFAGRAERLLEKELAKHGWTWQTPAFIREWLGKWIRDESSLVFAFDRTLNVVASAPAGLDYVVAVDLGASMSRETTAFVVIGYRPGEAYVVHAKRHKLLCPSDVGAELARLEEKYHPHSLVMDQGGLGRGYIEEIRRRWRLPVHEAQKSNKAGYVDLLNGDLRKGALRLVSGACDPLVEEIEILQWDEDRKGYDERYADHCSDAWLYAWRDCRHFLDGDPANEADDEADPDDPYESQLGQRNAVPFWKRSA